MAVKAAPNTPSTTTADVSAKVASFRDIDNVIGVSKKCCWCCDWLSKDLPVPGQDGFVLPGTHGTTLPWSPPIFDIPLATLVPLEQALMEKLYQCSLTRVHVPGGK
ncbi:hypothetical protein SCP_0503790 [Sparassis crispa]|uniref:Uncharacterized protein n=1 Tax=Sparassis crispa TaxID=139825 RepID=A0A401GM76_9APHY|nr:hypothetical protein SCP_0503790 [Sparassis crispa]GBE83331.1 hypothetical protein SCP_0503790 [Sparassis crispa]